MRSGPGRERGKLRRITAPALAAAFCSVVAGCGNDVSGPSVSDLVATWTVTRAEVASVANPATQEELVSQGFSATVVINANGSYSITSSIGSENTASSGTYVYSTGHLKLTDTSVSPPDVVNFTVALSGKTLTLGGGLIKFDFGSGEVPASLTLTMTKP